MKNRAVTIECISRNIRDNFPEGEQLREMLLQEFWHSFLRVHLATHMARRYTTGRGHFVELKRGAV